MALSDLLGDLEADEFFDKYWDQKPVIIRKASKMCAALCSIEDVEERLTETDIRFPQFQLAMQGRKLSKADYTRRKSWGNHHFDDLIDLPAMYRLWNAGATIILQSLQTNFPKLIPYMRELETDFHHPVQANLYLSPSNSQAFTAHYDTHDVFAVQVAGVKTWRVWQIPSEQMPLKDEHSPREIEPDGPLLLNEMLEPGDVLYLPRGYYHDARSEAVASMHLTIGVLSYRRIDAVRFIFDDILQSLRTSDDKAWRKALPPNFNMVPDKAFLSLKDRVLRMLDERWSMESSVNRFKEETHPNNQGLLKSHNKLAEIHDTTRLKVISAIDPVVYRSGEYLVLAFGGRLLSLPGVVESSLRSMLDMRDFSPSDLIKLNVESRIGLCAHLIREGFVAFK
jgi:ribosomal protein L16 Arg81 hydroxylase